MGKDPLEQLLRVDGLEVASKVESWHFEAHWPSDSESSQPWVHD